MWVMGDCVTQELPRSATSGAHSLCVSFSALLSSRSVGREQSEQARAVNGNRLPSNFYRTKRDLIKVTSLE